MKTCKPGYWEIEREARRKLYNESPAKAFDAVEDIKDYLTAADWNEISAFMSAISNIEEFSRYALSYGIKGYPVQAWYELYNGQNSWKTAIDKLKGVKS